MTRNAPGNLTATQRALLLKLADPAPAGPLALTVSDRDLDPILDAARAHAVLPVVRRRLAGTRNSAFVACIEQRQLDVAVLSGQSMRLMYFAHRIARTFERENVRFAIVKGPTFAELLYPQHSDRPFTDVDFLVCRDDVDTANEVMRELAFVSVGFADRPSEIFGEYKWEPPDGNNILIELHADLVHSPKLRANSSLTYEALVSAGEGNPQAPAALMLVAGLHASLGHQFERLQLLVDVLQAARHIAHTGSEVSARRACRSAGATLAVATALDLAASAFSEPVARALADSICDSSLRRVAQVLVSPRVAAGAKERTASRRSWRRKVYRQMLAMA